MLRRFLFISQIYAILSPNSKKRGGLKAQKFVNISVNILVGINPGR